MEIISPADHQLLSYALAVQQQGYTLTRDEFSAYAASPNRRPPTTAWESNLAVMARTLLATAVSTPGESAIEHFARVRWVAVEEDRVIVTSLGRSLARAADAGTREAEVLQTVLDPADPLAYARLVSRIFQLEDVLIVDPYFRQEQLLELYRLSSVTRVLTSEKVRTADLDALTVTAAAVRWNRDFEIRAASAGSIHDRYLIPKAGVVLQVGTSLNGVGGSVTVLSQLADVSDEIRDRLESEWNRANLLYPIPDEARPSTTASSE